MVQAGRREPEIRCKRLGMTFSSCSAGTVRGRIVRARVANASHDTRLSRKVYALIEVSPCNARVYAAITSRNFQRYIKRR